MTHTRREFLGASLGAAGSGILSGISTAGGNLGLSRERRPKVAAVFTEFRFRSHAYNILENFFKPFYFRGELVDPGCDVVSFYADQFPSNDMARDVSKKFKVPRRVFSSSRVAIPGGILVVIFIFGGSEFESQRTNLLGMLALHGV